LAWREEKRDGKVEALVVRARRTKAVKRMVGGW
jgi:hypothetical protein